MNETDLKFADMAEQLKIKDAEIKELKIANDALMNECNRLTARVNESDDKLLQYEKQMENQFGQIKAYKFCISGGQCDDKE